MIRTYTAGDASRDEVSPAATADQRSDFVRFYRENYSYLYWVVARHERFDGADADDVIQDAMLVMLEKWNKIENPRAFARAVIRHKAHDFRRRAANAIAFDNVEDLLHLLPPAAPATLLREQDEEVAKMVSRLPERQRQVFAMHLADFTTGEIASTLDLPEATVRSNLRFARERLRAYLNEV